MKKNKIKYLFIAAIALTTGVTSSCNKWLDTMPDNQISASRLFENEKGFQEALTGVYTLMTKADLYGREMTFGFADVIAQQWDLSSYNVTDKYSIAKSYNYEGEECYKLIETIWEKQYNAIANTNDILAFVDERKGVFYGNGYSIVKGEALALRAYLHFDLLRLFAPNDFVLGVDKKYIPYVDEFSKNLKESLTAKDVVAKCLADLSQAEELLKVDPIYTNIVSSDLYYVNRQVHLNYYAVKALQARIYLYMGEKDKALAAANEVIKAQTATKFRWVKSSDVTNSNEAKRDVTFSTEHIFRLNTKNIGETAKGYLNEYSTSNILRVRTHNNSVSTLFNDVPQDWRMNYTYGTEIGEPNVLRKFKQITDASLNIKEMMPMIRISEMYLIAAECEPNKKDALVYLNALRTNRNNTTAIVDVSNLDSEISKEYQREFTGEGQLFYYYKRLNKSIDGVGVAKFELPLPRLEIDLGGRPRPSSN